MRATLLFGWVAACDGTLPAQLVRLLGSLHAALLSFLLQPAAGTQHGMPLHSLQHLRHCLCCVERRRGADVRVRCGGEYSVERIGFDKASGTWGMPSLGAAPCRGRFCFEVSAQLDNAGVRLQQRAPCSLHCSGPKNSMVEKKRGG